MSHHVLRNRHLVIVLAIVNLKVEPDKVGQDGRRAGLRSDGGHLVVGALRKDDVETRSSCECVVRVGDVGGTLAYGTRLGPVRVYR